MYTEYEEKVEQHRTGQAFNYQVDLLVGTK